MPAHSQIHVNPHVEGLVLSSVIGASEARDLDQSSCMYVMVATSSLNAYAVMIVCLSTLNVATLNPQALLGSVAGYLTIHLSGWKCQNVETCIRATKQRMMTYNNNECTKVKNPQHHEFMLYLDA